MVPRVNAPQGLSTPDYLFRPNTIWNRIKKAKRQAHSFIVDITAAKHLLDASINEQIEKIFRDKETLFVDEIILIRNSEIVKIVKRA